VFKLINTFRCFPNPGCNGWSGCGIGFKVMNSGTSGSLTVIIASETSSASISKSEACPAVNWT